MAYGGEDFLERLAVDEFGSEHCLVVCVCSEMYAYIELPCHHPKRLGYRL